MLKKQVTDEQCLNLEETPLIIMEDADWNVLHLAVAGATKNSGQRCTAVKRILAEESIADALVKKLSIRLQNLNVEIRVILKPM